MSCAQCNGEGEKELDSCYFVKCAHCGGTGECDEECCEYYYDDDDDWESGDVFW